MYVRRFSYPEGKLGAGGGVGGVVLDIGIPT